MRVYRGYTIRHCDSREGIRIDDKDHMLLDIVDTEKEAEAVIDEWHVAP